MLPFCFRGVKFDMQEDPVAPYAKGGRTPQLICCTILTYVHNYVNIVTVNYLLSCLVKLVKIYSFFSILPVILILANKRLSIVRSVLHVKFLRFFVSLMRAEKPKILPIFDV